VWISAGEAVTNGQTLIVLDSREIEEQHIAAEAQFLEAKQDYDRTVRLMERDAATEKDLDMAQARYTASQAQLDQVRVMRSYTRIVSPLDGIVADRRIEAGDLAAPGTVLVTVYDPDNMRLEVPVPIRLVDHVALGQDMEVVMDYPSRFLTGTITEILGEIDPSSRTRTVKVHLTGDCGALPGTFGRLRIAGGERPALLVPAAAVQRTGQLEMVRLVKDDRVVRRLVKTVTGPHGRRELISGLNPGDAIVLPANGVPADEI
jgi:RND family efflux transporter MFP subunit